MKNILCMVFMCMCVADFKAAEMIDSSESVGSQIFRPLCLKLDPTQLSHKDLVTIGLVCRGWDKLLRTNTVESEARKKYILEECGWLGADSELLKWHGYGSSACCKIIEPYGTSYTGKKLVLGYLELCDKGFIRKQFGSFKHFYSELCHTPRPFHDANHRLLFFFGLGLIWIDDIVEPRLEVLLHRANSYISVGRTEKHVGRKDTTRCMLSYRDKNGRDFHQSIVAFLDFRYLLKDILGSKFKFIANYACVYDLDKVTLSKNYDEYTETDPEKAQLFAFQKLPEDLQYALAKRYQEQQKEALKE